MKKWISYALRIICIILAESPLMAFETTIGQVPKNLGPPLIIAPQNDWTVTDYALSFTWQRQEFLDEEDEDSQWSIGTYQIQVSKTAAFLNPQLDIYHLAPGLNLSRFEDGEDHDEEDLEFVESHRHWTESVYSPEENLESGTWYWRVRAADKPNRPWSEVVGFNLIRPGKSKKPSRTISAKEPIFSFDMYDSDGGGWGDEPPWTKYWNFFPEKLKPFVAFAIPHDGWGGYYSPSRSSNGNVRSFQDFIEPLTEEKIPVLIKTGGPDKDPQGYLSTTELEHIYQTNPNVLGLVAGENTWAHIGGFWNTIFRKHEVQWFNEVIKLSSQYGKYIIAGEGSYAFAWDKFFGKEAPTKYDRDGELSGDYVWLDPEILRKSTETFIPTGKSNLFWSHHQMNSAVLGASISNLVANHGTWAEAWYWSTVGFTKGVFEDFFASEADADFSTMPHILWVQTMLVGAASGSVVFHFGGESSVTENRGRYDKSMDAMVEEDGSIWHDDDGQETGREYASFWDMYGNKTKGFDRYIIPFLTAIIEEELIPTKSQVMAEIKLAIDPGPVESDKGNFVCYGHYLTLYKNTYGLNDLIAVDQDIGEDEIGEVNTGCKYELLPNSGRYYFIPVIPHPANTFSHPGIKVIPIGKLQSEKAVKAEFDPVYPQFSQGTAWVAKVDNTYFITNSNENLNEEQDFSIDFSGPLSRIEGNSIPHSYFIFRYNKKEGLFWLQANAEKGVSYTDQRQTIIKLDWNKKPFFKVEPKSALIYVEWSSNSVKLKLSHSEGAVQVKGSF